MTDVLALAERFFKAIEGGDVETARAIYHPDAVIWHNFDPLDEREKGQSVAENLKIIESLPKRIIGGKYEIYQREATETGFLQQHVLTGRLVNGEPIVLPACIVCRVEDGCITRLDEYFDPAIITRLYKVTTEFAEKQKK